MSMLVVVRGGGGASSRPDGMPTTIAVAILDIEEGWRDVVSAVGESARRILGGGPDDADAVTVASSTHVVWGGRCGVARSLYDPINSDCLDLVGRYARLYAIQYCVGENTSSIRAVRPHLLPQAVRCVDAWVGVRFHGGPSPYVAGFLPPGREPGVFALHAYRISQEREADAAAEGGTTRDDDGLLRDRR